MRLRAVSPPQDLSRWVHNVETVRDCVRLGSNTIILGW